MIRDSHGKEAEESRWTAEVAASRGEAKVCWRCSARGIKLDYYLNRCCFVCVRVKVEGDDTSFALYARESFHVDK